MGRQSGKDLGGCGDLLGKDTLGFFAGLEPLPGVFLFLGQGQGRPYRSCGMRVVLAPAHSAWLTALQSGSQLPCRIGQAELANVKPFLAVILGRGTGSKVLLGDLCQLVGCLGMAGHNFHQLSSIGCFALKLRESISRRFQWFNQAAHSCRFFTQPFQFVHGPVDCCFMVCLFATLGGKPAGDVLQSLFVREAGFQNRIGGLEAFKGCAGVCCLQPCSFEPFP
ncbi:hypothetical protein PJL18_02450 [Paenarthrobacter nicotinovorans]|nr:hypothetical protein [Paenarthrobacter nicotinovorans]